MSNYNLKAKNKQTGEIVEFKELKTGGYITENNDLYNKDQFNELYEIVEDEPLFKRIYKVGEYVDISDMKIKFPYMIKHNGTAQVKCERGINDEYCKLVVTKEGTLYNLEIRNPPESLNLSDESLFKPYKIKFRRDDKFKLKPEAEEIDGKVLDFRFGWDIEDGIYKGEKAMIPKTSYLAWVATGDLEEIEDPNHPYVGGEVLDNVPKETWRTRLYDLYVDNFFEPHDGQIEDFFQQELERIKTNFMKEFTDPDTGMLDIGKYDHEEIINFFNKEIR